MEEIEKYIMGEEAKTEMNEAENQELNETEETEKCLEEEVKEEICPVSEKAHFEFLFRDIDGEAYCENESSVCDCKKGNLLDANFYETPTKYVVECLAVGLQKEDIEATYKNDVLTISIQKSKYKVFGKTTEDLDFDCYERRFLVRDVDFRKIKGVLKNGILTISIPKKEIVGEPRKIRIS